MVTLQILVLSFLVRIQVAQLKRLSFEGRFFVLCCLLEVAYRHCCDVSCMQMRASQQLTTQHCKQFSSKHDTPTHDVRVVLTDSHFVLVEPI